MIYLHIPFCKQKCSYCNFHFSTSLNLKSDFLVALRKEILLRKNEINTPIKTLYFGGGTPSILSEYELSHLLDFLNTHFEFDENIEITLEANPDDLTKDYIKALSNTQINRLSIGIQSFDDEDLKLMKRAHTAKESKFCIKYAQDSGLTNISADLIYGSPISGLSVWKNNLQKIIDYQIPHISAYALTIEPKTLFEAWVKSGKMAAPSENFQNESFVSMRETLLKNDFEHYEISNFAKAGWESKHNSAYWQNLAYLGLGPSAHSFDGKSKRSWNIANNALYIKSLMKNERPFESEILSAENQYNEFVMIGLRTKKGINLIDFEKRMGTEHSQKLLMACKDKEEYFEISTQYIKLKPDYWFLADGIASDMFI